MTGPGKRLIVVTVACILIGLAAVVAAWRNPAGGFTVLATAAGWPWAWAALEGGLVWRRGRAMQSSGLEHALAMYTAGGAAALLIGTLAFAVVGVDLPGGSQLPCGPLEPLCAAFTCLALACGCAAGPWGSFSRRCCRPLLLGSAPSCSGHGRSWAWMRGSVAVTTPCWLVVLLTGLVLAFA